MSAIHADFSLALSSESWIQRVSQVKDALIWASGRHIRPLSSKYHQARSILSQICVSKPPYEWPDQEVLLDVVADAQELGRIIDRRR